MSLQVARIRRAPAIVGAVSPLGLIFSQRHSGVIAMTIRRTVFLGLLLSLSLVSSRTLAQTSEFPCLDGSEHGDDYGRVVASGDFNGDGYMDLAVGAPLEDFDGAVDSGHVFVFKGRASGLVPWFNLSQRGLGGTERGDLYGSALATGDFNGDGYDDLAIGAPGEAPNADPRSGYVFVFRGGLNGLFPWFGLDQTGLGSNEVNDRFGTSLATGDFNNDDFMDLAVGAPGEAPRSNIRSGYVFLFKGTESGLDPWQGVDQEGLGANELADEFGASLVAADFDHDGRSDLAVGAPGEAPFDDPRSGFVFVFRGANTGVVPWVGLDQEGLGPNELADRFGTSLAAGDFDGDSRVDLAVGAPGEAPGPHPRSGYVFLFRNTAAGLNPWVGLDQSGLGANELADGFGTSLSTGYLDRDNKADLIVGAPGEAPNADPRSGYVFVFRGTTRGVSPWYGLDQEGLGANEVGDGMGTAVATGDFNRDGRDDLAVGGPGEAPGAAPRGGYVFIYRAQPSGVLAASQGLRQPSISRVVDVSVKIILDANGRRPRGDYQTDEQIRRAIRDANVVLQNNDVQWSLYMREIRTVSDESSYFVLADEDEMRDLEDDARDNPGTFFWRNDAINIYVVQDVVGLGGICSFPIHDEIIAINCGGILNSGVGWLHEIGHYLSLTHTFSGDRDVCRDLGAFHRGARGRVDCSDNCPHDNNVMSYNPFDVEDAQLSECQKREMRFELCDVTGSRSHVFHATPITSPSESPDAGTQLSDALVPFRRGDSNNDGHVQISDAIATLEFLFLGGEGPDCFDASDANDDGEVELSDAVVTLGTLFLGNEGIADPGILFCSPDGTQDGLPDCEYTSSSCNLDSPPGF